MERAHKLFRTEEFYSQNIRMIKDSIREIQQEIHPLKKFLGDRKREVVRQLRVSDHEAILDTLKHSQTFYEYALKELMGIEEECATYLLRIEIDLLAAMKDRALSPSYLSLEEVEKAYRTFIYCDDFDQINDEGCRCTWENKPYWNLEDTRNILLRPRETTRTKLDESDLKFKQDMIYLRTKMFSLPKGLTKRKIRTRRTSARLPKAVDFIQIFKEEKNSNFVSTENEVSKINNLKFIDGKFTICDIWLRVLDAYKNQYGTKWHVFCQQIKKIMNKRRIPSLHLNPHATLRFMSKIQENGVNFALLKEDLIPLLEDNKEALWLKSWKLQFQSIDGKHVAATLIQAFWRGYLLRKKKRDTECLYIAASFIWFSWITLKKKREIHQRYLRRMLISLQATRELSLKLSKEFHSIIKEPHVVLHLTSIGIPLDMRRDIVPKTFGILQNMLSLRICFVRNPVSEVIYILPVKPTQDLLLMYSDFVESISPEENTAKQITFIALSQAETLQCRTMNLSRVLHCSEESLNEIRKKIAGKPAYFLPWIIDECDMRLAGNLDVPLLSSDMELQRKFLNESRMAEIVDSFGLSQPPYAKDIRDYESLCANLSRLIALHTEICMWLIKLNFGLKGKHYGVFLINHISISFMPILRREREKHGEKWQTRADLREEYHEKLKEHLPKTVSSTTRLPKMYNSWKKFYFHIQKFGCLVQAVPVEKHAKTVAVSLFFPGQICKEKPRWMGTADKMRLETTFPTFVYMLPESSIDITKLEPTVNKFAMGMQNQSYFGYLTVDCYCYTHKQEEKLVVLILNVDPFYSHGQSYIDWMKFAIGGWYNEQENKFIADVTPVSNVRRRKSSFLVSQRTPKWNETTERHAIAISQLHDTRFSAYRWSKLKDLLEECGIKYDAKMKQGSSILLHDGEVKSFALMVIVSPCMKTTLSMVHNSLKKLNQSLMTKSKINFESNLSALIDFFSKLSLDYENLADDECL